MATQAQILAKVRTRLNEAVASFWTDAALRDWINEAAADIARVTESIRATASVSVVANTGSYAFAPTPSAIRVTELEFTPTGQSLVLPLEYRDRTAMREVWGTWQATGKGYPSFWTSWGAPGLSHTVQLYPVPSVAGSLTVYHYRFPAVLATDGTAAASTVEIPAGWDDVIVDGVEYRALRRDRDPAWQDAYNLFNEHLGQLAEAGIRFSDQAGLVTTQGGGWYPSNWFAQAEDW